MSLLMKMGSLCLLETPKVLVQHYPQIPFQMLYYPLVPPLNVAPSSSFTLTVTVMPHSNCYADFQLHFKYFRILKLHSQVLCHSQDLLTRWRVLTCLSVQVLNYLMILFHLVLNCPIILICPSLHLLKV